MSNAFHWLSDNWPGILLVFFLISEIMPFIKNIRANGWADAITILFKNLSKGRE